MPSLQVLRLSNDHTSGTTTNKITPTAAVADNDLALGQVIEAVSHSKFWTQTAIFVVEDDAQNGPDHVDAHRTIAFVVSPSPSAASWIPRCIHRQHVEDDGTDPRPEAMSQFDAEALPMYHAFTSQPDCAPTRRCPRTWIFTSAIPNRLGSQPVEEDGFYQGRRRGDRCSTSDLALHSRPTAQCPRPNAPPSCAALATDGDDD